MSPKAILMMLKSFGIDIDVEKANVMVQDFMTHAPEFVKELKTKVDSVELRLARIEELLANIAAGKQGDAIVDEKVVHIGGRNN